jgi:sortase (surface protein transpeptidase)
VRQNRTVSPDDTSVLKHENAAWITLLTCKTYNEATNTYANRIAIRAALSGSQEDEPSRTPGSRR